MLTSEEPKFYFDADSHRDRLAVFLGRLKLPRSHRFEGLFVKSHAQSALNFQTARAPGGIDDQSQNHSSLILSLASLFGILRIRLVDCAGRGYAADTRPENSATVAA